MEIREVAHGGPEYEATIELRLRVLRRPLGLSFTPDQLAGESNDIHLAAFDDGCVVGCLILSPHNQGALHMRQVAVLPELQRQGIGRKLVSESERVARSRGFRELVLHARDTAVPFYEAVGYQAEGETFEEVTIPHVAMRKSLPTDPSDTSR